MAAFVYQGCPWNGWLFPCQCRLLGCYTLPILRTSRALQPTEIPLRSIPASVPHSPRGVQPRVRPLVTYTRSVLRFRDARRIASTGRNYLSSTGSHQPNAHAPMQFASYGVSHRASRICTFRPKPSSTAARPRNNLGLSPAPCDAG